MGPTGERAPDALDMFFAFEHVSRVTEHRSQVTHICYRTNPIDATRRGGLGWIDRGG